MKASILGSLFFLFSVICVAEDAANLLDRRLATFEQLEREFDKLLPFDEAIARATQGVTDEQEVRQKITAVEKEYASRAKQLKERQYDIIVDYARLVHDEGVDYYKLLGVKPGASIQEIDQQYIKQSRLDPDNKMLISAYETLRDDQKRAWYDAAINRGSSVAALEYRDLKMREPLLATEGTIGEKIRRKINLPKVRNVLRQVRFNIAQAEQQKKSIRPTDDDRNYYAQVGVSTSASREDILSRQDALRKQYQERYTPAAAAEYFKHDYGTIFSTLLNREQRAAYDKQLGVYRPGITVPEQPPVARRILTEPVVPNISGKTHYEILNIDPAQLSSDQHMNRTILEQKAAVLTNDFVKYMQQTSKDLSKNSLDYLRTLNEIKKVLLDPKKRVVYDLDLLVSKKGRQSENLYSLLGIEVDEQGRVPRMGDDEVLQQRNKVLDPINEVRRLYPDIILSPEVNEFEKRVNDAYERLATFDRREFYNKKANITEIVPPRKPRPVGGVYESLPTPSRRPRPVGGVFDPIQVRPPVPPRYRR